MLAAHALLSVRKENLRAMSMHDSFPADPARNGRSSFHHARNSPNAGNFSPRSAAMQETPFTTSRAMDSRWNPAYKRSQVWLRLRLSYSPLALERRVDVPCNPMWSLQVMFAGGQLVLLRYTRERDHAAVQTTDTETRTSFLLSKYHTKISKILS